MLVVDGSHALTGGMNVGDEYARHWHDLVTRVRGPAVGQLRDVFREDWYCCTGEHLERLPAPVEGDAEVAVVPSGPDRELVCAHDLLFQTLASATRAAYRVMSSVPGLLSRLAGPDPTRRVRAATKVFRRFPFGPPSYVMEDVEDGERTVAFDVLRCPVAEYFDAASLNELCARSFCDLDYELAAEWGASLQRETTLARGDGACSFRWRT